MAGRQSISTTSAGKWRWSPRRSAAPRARRYSQLHWGGGTPTFLSGEEMRALLGLIDAQFSRAPGAELSLEVDPRRVEPGRMALLGALGFNRLSVGVQDFDAQVQQAVHRIQSEEETRRVIDEARASGFRSVNLDLIYGLPLQTLDSFNATLDKVLDARPGPHRALQLRAPAGAVQAAAAHRRGRPAVGRRRSCRSSRSPSAA